MAEKVVRITEIDSKLKDFILMSIRANPESGLMEEEIIYKSMLFNTIFIGFDGDKPKTIISVSISPRLKIPSVSHFYSSGSATLRRLTIKYMVDWINGKGYTSFRTINTNAGRDKAFKRLFGDVGEMREAGTVYIFEVK